MFIYKVSDILPSSVRVTTVHRAFKKEKLRYHQYSKVTFVSPCGNVLYEVIDNVHVYVLVEEKIDLLIKDKLQISNVDDSAPEKQVRDVYFSVKTSGTVMPFLQNHLLFLHFPFSNCNRKIIWINTWDTLSRIFLDFLSLSSIHSSLQTRLARFFSRKHLGLL